MSRELRYICDDCGVVHIIQPDKRGNMRCKPYGWTTWLLADRCEACAYPEVARADGRWVLRCGVGIVTARTLMQLAEKALEAFPKNEKAQRAIDEKLAELESKAYD